MRRRSASSTRRCRYERADPVHLARDVVIHRRCQPPSAPSITNGATPAEANGSCPGNRNSVERDCVDPVESDQDRGVLLVGDEHRIGEDALDDTGHFVAVDVEDDAALRFEAAFEN